MHTSTYQEDDVYGKQTLNEQINYRLYRDVLWWQRADVQLSLSQALVLGDTKNFFHDIFREKVSRYWVYHRCKKTFFYVF